jgi:hypothetical protein
VAGWLPLGTLLGSRNHMQLPSTLHTPCHPERREATGMRGRAGGQLPSRGSMEKGIMEKILDLGQRTWVSYCLTLDKSPQSPHLSNGCNSPKGQP